MQIRSILCAPSSFQREKQSQPTMKKKAITHTLSKLISPQSPQSEAAAATRQHTIHTIDTHFGGYSLQTAMFLLTTCSLHSQQQSISACFSQPSSSDKTACLIENNNSNAFPNLVEALRLAGYAFEHIKYLIVTHVHLDHSAATGYVLERCPNATVLCHPRARKHLIDPASLIASAKKTYGEEDFEKHVGIMLPCPEDRVRQVGDGEVIKFTDDRELVFHHVEGHARHHIAVHDRTMACAFTGDGCGVSYNDISAMALKGAVSSLAKDTILPTSSPIDFDYRAAMNSVNKITSLTPLDTVCLTHFGLTPDVQTVATQMRYLLPQYERVRVQLSYLFQKCGYKYAELSEIACKEMRTIIESYFCARGLVFEETEGGACSKERLFANRCEPDVNVNAQGLVVAAMRFPVDFDALAESIAEANAQLEKQRQRILSTHQGKHTTTNATATTTTTTTRVPSSEKPPEWDFSSSTLFTERSVVHPSNPDIVLPLPLRDSCTTPQLVYNLFFARAFSEKLLGYLVRENVDGARLVSLLLGPQSGELSKDLIDAGVVHEEELKKLKRYVATNRISAMPLQSSEL